MTKPPLLPILAAVLSVHWVACREPAAERPDSNVGAVAAAVAPPDVPDVDAWARRYLALVARAWRVEPLPGAMYGVFGPPPPPDGTPPVDLAREIPRLRDDVEALRGEIAERAGATTRSPRADWIDAHLEAVDARLRMLAGETLSPREQARRIFGLDVAPGLPVPEAELRAAREALAALLQGTGAPRERYERWRESLRVPPAELGTALRLVVDECRRRAAPHFPGPDGGVTLVLEDGVPYGGFAEAAAGGRTVLHVNVARPLAVDDLPHFLAHEGYPGHHLALLVLGRLRAERPELSLLPPLSPTNALLEGGADALAAALLESFDLTAWLEAELLPAIGMTDVDARLLVAARPHLEVLRGARLDLPALLEAGRSAAEVVDWYVEQGWVSRPLAEAVVADLLEGPFPAAFAWINQPGSPAATRLRAELGSWPDAVSRFAERLEVAR